MSTSMPLHVEQMGRLRYSIAHNPRPNMPRTTQTYPYNPPTPSTHTFITPMKPLNQCTSH